MNKLIIRNPNGKKKDEIIMDSIFDAICKFEEDTGSAPEKIYLTEHEIISLNREVQKNMFLEQKIYLKESLFPELLLPSREHKNIDFDSYIYGVQIIKSETGGYLLS